MGNKKIMICDDDEGILDVLEMILEDTGHTVIAEQNSMNAIGLIQSTRPDLVVLDLWMPVISGDQILKAVRNSPETASLPVLVMSASRDGKEIALAAGASEYISKPFDFDHLVAVVDRLIS
ncbi:response regulator [Pedobacter sp. 22226]|uniref:response regulator n=1 Tax=Pedobacter sp. 22226 TaxID=3453894 RepID=UPI003F8294ED